MATILHDGQRTWSMTRDSDGHRTYKVKHLVESATTDGPFNVLATAGLFLPGAAWSFDDDFDIWAFCRPDAVVNPINEKEPNKWWEVEQTFSTKPLNRCTDTPIEDPLLEPPKVSGSFVKFTTAATHDRFGEPIVNSAHEQFRGPAVEFDDNRPTVKIEMNLAFLDLSLISSMVDTVNDSTLWGLTSRKIKLSNVSWERKVYGECSYYYTLMLEFEINFDTFDRDLLDEGTKVLRGHWSNTTGFWVLDNIAGEEPNSSNPGHFIRFKDRNNENARVILNGSGVPAGVGVGTGSGSVAGDIPGEVHVEYYGESNFLLLGIPLIF